MDQQLSSMKRPQPTAAWGVGPDRLKSACDAVVTWLDKADGAERTLTVEALRVNGRGDERGRYGDRSTPHGTASVSLRSTQADVRTVVSKNGGYPFRIPFEIGSVATEASPTG